MSPRGPQEPVSPIGRGTGRVEPARPPSSGLPTFRQRMENPVAGAGNPVTPDLVLGRYAGATRLNARTLPVVEWTPIRVDRPAIVVPQIALQEYVGATVAPSTQPRGEIFYSPEKPQFPVPAFDGAGAIPDFRGIVQRSTRHGVCYLPNPGNWWLYFDTAGTTALDVIIIDGSDPAVASRYLNEPGVHGVLAGTFLTAGTAAAGIQIIPANRDRLALTIQNGQATGILRLWFNSAVSPTLGFRLIAGQAMSITFSGDTCWKGPIWVTDEGGATPARATWADYY